MKCVGKYTCLVSTRVNFWTWFEQLTTSEKLLAQHTKNSTYVYAYTNRSVMRLGNRRKNSFSYCTHDFWIFFFNCVRLKNRAVLSEFWNIPDGVDPILHSHLLFYFKWSMCWNTFFKVVVSSWHLTIVYVSWQAL